MVSCRHKSLLPSTLFPFSAAVLVSSTRAVEVLTSLGQYLCSLPDLPDPRHSHSQTGLVTCGGGETPASCLTFSPASGAWAASHTLAKPGREAHSSWATGGEVSLYILMINIIFKESSGLPPGRKKQRPQQ